MTDNNNANDGVRMFAKGGIAAAMTINFGALLATFPHVPNLMPLTGLFQVAVAIEFWTAGVGLAALAWVLAALTASSHANDRRKAEVVIGVLVYVVAILSVLMFIFGSMNITIGLHSYAIVHD